jgi:hypothetical protein
MSTLKADTIQNTTGGAVTLTKQSPLKAFGAFDMSDNGVVDSFNIASYTDRATGSLYGNYTNSMSSAAHVVTASSAPAQEGSLATTDDNRHTVANSDTSGRYASNTSLVSTHSTKDDDDYIAGMVAGDLA